MDLYAVELLKDFIDNYVCTLSENEFFRFLKYRFNFLDYTDNSEPGYFYLDHSNIACIYNVILNNEVIFSIDSFLNDIVFVNESISTDFLTVMGCVFKSELKEYFTFSSYYFLKDKVEFRGALAGTSDFIIITADSLIIN